MDPNHREALRDLFAPGGTRRVVVAALLSLPFLSGSASVVAKRRKRNRKRRRCRGGETRCGRRCVCGACCPGLACGGAEPNCLCGSTTEGGAFCQTGGVIVVAPCASSAECNPGFACILDADIAGGSFCVPPCGFEP